MFWGLILEPNKRYTQTVEKSFHVSMASLNLQKADDSVVQVMLYYEGTSYLLCNLRKSSTWQVPLDLNFHEGTTIAFICHGHGHVHLTGYLIPDEDLDLDELEEEEDEEEEEEEQVPQLVDKQSKRKAIDTLKNEKNTKRLKQEIEAESSDEDIELDGMNEENDSDDSEEGDEESLLNEDEDEDEDEEDEEEDKEDEEEEEKVKPQQKDKRNKQQQQQQKKKIVNGKEAKQKKDKREQQQNETNTQSDQKTRVVEGGVQIKELKVGNGVFAKSGKLVSVYYVGRLKNGKKFDATTQGDGFKFRLGKGEVIKGWDVGIQGMKVGGKRQITIPPAMAYGAKGSPPVIPGNSTLVFEVELRNVH
ncbi:46 kDa FK506-binding nuclear protein-like [Bombus pyrosoma]|uniref:46 kDa FK506-binding nuclear protein-like n=1 Tax=Bombus pyrosoma TaxID=396416 RepID=UPI001CB9C51D|nr:46 kDa FK506-binding nuclear protein-like [Bombus pyrosoma]